MNFPGGLESQSSKSIKSSSEGNNGPKQGFYCLGQFPYPSGTIHLGHFRVYSKAVGVETDEADVAALLRSGLRACLMISEGCWKTFGTIVL